MELIKISQNILNNIKKIIDREAKNNKKAVGFSQLTNWYATGIITKGQLQKIISFYDHPPTGDDHNGLKKIYDEIHILPWAKSQIAHLKRVDATLRKVHQYTGTNREVDRVIKPGSASILPPKSKITEEIERFKQIIQYIN